MSLLTKNRRKIERNALLAAVTNKMNDLVEMMSKKHEPKLRPHDLTQCADEHAQQIEDAKRGARAYLLEPAEAEPSRETLSADFIDDIWRWKDALKRARASVCPWHQASGVIVAGALGKALEVFMRALGAYADDLPQLYERMLELLGPALGAVFLMPLTRYAGSDERYAPDVDEMFGFQLLFELEPFELRACTMAKTFLCSSESGESSFLRVLENGNSAVTFNDMTGYTETEESDDDDDDDVEDNAEQP